MNSRLVNMNEMLKDAHDGKYAVAHININNLEWIKGVLSAAQETNTPVILGVSEGAAKYMCGFKNVVDMVNNVLNTMNISQPVALHLDHGTFEGAKAALAAGFSSVMYDGSHLPFEQNINETKEILAIAQKQNASVEAEVGAIGGEEDGKKSGGELADIDQCSKIAQLPISCLAAGIGNIHGIYPADWKGLNLEQLKKIHDATNGKPLVLHGGTGIPDAMVQDAIKLGICKVNVNTELQLVFAEATRKYIEAGKDTDTKSKGFDPRKLLKPGVEAIKDKCIEKFTVFGSSGKA
ncbi:MAG: class II fructose-1,6-bisphosphate aldolase [Mycoplasmataceae bacterium]|nr:class II fructose-1,6-bisphosphate aldolase [Mycoplasmataceae bacterium]